MSDTDPLQIIVSTTSQVSSDYRLYLDDNLYRLVEKDGFERTPSGAHRFLAAHPELVDELGSHGDSVVETCTLDARYSIVNPDGTFTDIPN